jgi:hypothetical protein
MESSLRISVNPKTSNSTIIPQMNSSVNQSDVATDTVKCNHHKTIAPVYSIPIIITRLNVRNNQPKGH